MDDKDWGILLYEAMILERQGSSRLADARVGGAIAVVLNERANQPVPPLSKPFLPSHNVLELSFA